MNTRVRIFSCVPKPAPHVAIYSYVTDENGSGAAACNACAHRSMKVADIESAVNNTLATTVECWRAVDRASLLPGMSSTPTYCNESRDHLHWFLLNHTLPKLRYNNDTH